MEEFINITKANIENEHLCCAIGDPKHQDGVKEKKEHIISKLDNGYVFRKLNAKGKIFIEYEPLDNALVPIVGDNYLYIYCLWVAGSFKGKGYGKSLLSYAINDAKERGLNGVCVLSSKKKKPFLSDKQFFLKYGFQAVDSVNDYELLALSFNNTFPKFSDSARKMKIDNKDFTIYYNSQCPYILNSINELRTYSKEHSFPIEFIKIDTREKALNQPCVFNNWASFYNGKFISNTILNVNSFEKIIK